MSDKEFELIVIGSGPGGYVAAIKAAQLGLKTACIEKYPSVGGTCLNVGCVPSKALLQSSEMLYKMRHETAIHGIECGSISYNFGKMMQRKQEIIQSFNKGIQSLFKKNKVTFIQGKASFLDEHHIQVDSAEGSQTYKANHFICATGSKPTALPFAKFDEEKIISSTGALSLKQVPKKLLVVGAGIIGVELGSVYSRLGSEVVFLEYMDRICPTLDTSVSKAFQKILEKQGLIFHLQTKVTDLMTTQNGIFAKALVQNELKEFEADLALVAVGRKPYTEGLGLDKIGVKMTDRGYVSVDANFRTNIPHILAIGDIIDGPMLAHKAEEEGIAAAEILAGHQPKVSYALIPNVVYTDPEIGCVGFTEEELRAKNISYKAVEFPLKANSRARCMGDDSGFVKMIVEKSTQQILGVHILAPHAGELIGEAVVAMQQRLSAKELGETFHAHPTLSEAIKEASLLAAFKAIHL